jgi:hypothetical protein
MYKIVDFTDNLLIKGCNDCAVCNITKAALDAEEDDAALNTLIRTATGNNNLFIHRNADSSYQYWWNTNGEEPENWDEDEA